MLVLKKEQVVNVTLEEVNGHMDFDILEIPTQRLGALYALIPNEQQTKMAVPTEKAQKIFYTPDFPARREVFEHLKTAFSCTKDTSKGCSNCNNKSCIENEELIPYFLLFLLTAFLRLPESYEIILSSAQITLKSAFTTLYLRHPVDSGSLRMLPIIYLWVRQRSNGNLQKKVPALATSTYRQEWIRQQNFYA